MIGHHRYSDLVAVAALVAEMADHPERWGTYTNARERERWANWLLIRRQAYRTPEGKEWYRRRP